MCNKTAILLSSILFLTLLTACDEKEANTDTDTDTDTDGDPNAGFDLCGEVTTSEYCEASATVSVWTILEGTSACDDNAIFYDTGLESSWEDWRETEAATPSVESDGSFRAVLEDGEYAVRHLEDCYGCTSFTISGDTCVSVALELEEAEYADAPNVYLYPEETTAVHVRVAAPAQIAVADPDYPRGGWNVLAQPNGLIHSAEGIHDYLFYEMAVPETIFQTTEGWCVEGTHAQSSIENAMELYGFLPNEIHDFSEFWDPWFPKREWFTVYPQSAKLPPLRINPVPDNLLRVWFVVEPGCHAAFEPAIQPVPRTGYHASEWGVVFASEIERGWAIVE